MKEEATGYACYRSKRDFGVVQRGSSRAVFPTTAERPQPAHPATSFHFAAGGLANDFTTPGSEGDFVHSGAASRASTASGAVIATQAPPRKNRVLPYWSL